MPIYEYKCQSCNKVFDKYLNVIQLGKTLFCDHCGSVLKKLISKPNINPDVNFETEDITGENIKITSRRQLKELCNEHGVSPL